MRKDGRMDRGKIQERILGRICHSHLFESVLRQIHQLQQELYQTDRLI